jgi:hypothetical protein
MSVGVGLCANSKMPTTRSAPRTDGNIGSSDDDDLFGWRDGVF